MQAPRAAANAAPSSADAVPAPAFWRRRARLTALRHNAGRVLGAMLPAWLAMSLVFACALLVARRFAAAGMEWWVVYGVGLLACAVVAVWLAGRRGFFSVADALVRLEWNLGLHNRLSAAAAGVGAFPPARATAPDGYTFRWGKILPPLAGALALVAAAATVPVTHPAATFLPPEQPVAWTQTAELLDAAKKTDLVQEPALEDYHERLEQLRQQPARDWYSQSSLEAGDNLHNQAEQSLQSLQRDLQTAANDLETMEHFDANTPAADLKAAGENLRNALKGLELGNLPLTREVLDKLKSIDPANLKSLSPAQLKELQERLRNGAKIVEATLKPGQPGGDKPGTKPGEKVAVVAVPGGGTGPSKPGGPPGPGGGTDPTPLTLNDKPTQLQTTNTAPLANNTNDPDHSLPGEIVGVGKGEHTVDPSKYTGPAPGGTASSEGAGGEAVWRDDLTPQERDVLRHFFK